MTSLRRAAGTVLIATVFLLTVELLRATSPLLDRAATDLGVVGAAGLAVVIFVAPALIGVAVALAGAARAVLGGVALLVLLRVLAQVPDFATLSVVGAGAAVAIATLVLVVRCADNGVSATVGVLAGGVADLGLRGVYGSWDTIFRPGVLPWLVVLAIGTVAIAAVLFARPGRVAAAGWVGVLGPYLALYVLAYGSAPIVAAHAQASLPVAGVVLIVAAVLAIEVVRRTRLPGGTGVIPEPDRWFAGGLAVLALVGSVAVAYYLTGTVVLFAAAVAMLAAAVLCARALTWRRDTDPHGQADRSGQARGFALAAAVAGVGYVLPVMIYQVHYDLEFPFDNRIAVVGAALVLGVAGVGSRPRERFADRRDRWQRPAPVALLAAAALLLPLTMMATHSATPAPQQEGSELRLMSWNVLYGRDYLSGAVDPEAVAVAIEEHDPDVVLLQEVSRGWPIGGGVDMLEWLARRLAMSYEWAPAADGQFGNAILTRMEYSDPHTERFPFLQGPMDRSYQAVTLQLASGEQMRVYNTHFQHRKGNTQTRLAHTELLLSQWDERPHTIIAGDFNFWPSWQEALRWDAAGFVSAQDVTGHAAEFTVPSNDPDNRVDWIFGTQDLTFSEFAILSDIDNSDHFPLVVTVTVD